MTFLLASFSEVIPMLAFVAIGVVLFAIASVASNKQKKEQARREEEVLRNKAQQRAETNVSDVRLQGRKEPQNFSSVNSAAQPTVVSHQNIPHKHVDGAVASTVDGHTHVDGTEEFYDASGGSLGDVSEEGCLDLKGVRLIVHDPAYENDDKPRDYSEIAKAMVLGEILDKPRCKTIYKRR